MSAAWWRLAVSVLLAIVHLSGRLASRYIPHAERARHPSDSATSARPKSARRVPPLSEGPVPLRNSLRLLALRAAAAATAAATTAISRPRRGSGALLGSTRPLQVARRLRRAARASPRCGCGASGAGRGRAGVAACQVRLALHGAAAGAEQGARGRAAPLSDRHLRPRGAGVGSRPARQPLPGRPPLRDTAMTRRWHGLQACSTWQGGRRRRPREFKARMPRETSEKPPRASGTFVRLLRDSSETLRRHLRGTSEAPPKHLRGTSVLLAPLTEATSRGVSGSG